MNIVVGYVSALMEKELDEISAIEEDKRNLINLFVFYEKKDMNGDLFQIICDNLIRTPKTFAPYLANLEAKLEANLEDSESSIRNVVRQL
jgi:hypothetical protein